jgi:hypothetical protein
MNENRGIRGKMQIISYDYEFLRPGEITMENLFRIVKINNAWLAI